MSSNDQADRLAELIIARAKFVADERDRRKDAKGVIETYDRDIAKLAENINAGQADLFGKDEDAD